MNCEYQTPPPHHPDARVTTMHLIDALKLS